MNASVWCAFCLCHLRVCHRRSSRSVVFAAPDAASCPLGLVGFDVLPEELELVVRACLRSRRPAAGRERQSRPRWRTARWASPPRPRARGGSTTPRLRGGLRGGKSAGAGVVSACAGSPRERALQRPRALPRGGRSSTAGCSAGPPSSLVGAPPRARAPAAAGSSAGAGASAAGSSAGAGSLSGRLRVGRGAASARDEGPRVGKQTTGMMRAIGRVREEVARTHLGGSLGGGFFLGHVRARAVRVRVDVPSDESTVLRKHDRDVRSPPHFAGREAAARDGCDEKRFDENAREARGVHVIVTARLGALVARGPGRQKAPRPAPREVRHARRTSVPARRDLFGEPGSRVRHPLPI